MDFTAICLIIIGTAKVIAPRTFRHYRTDEIFGKKDQFGSGYIILSRIIGVAFTVSGVLILLNKV